MYLFPCDGDFYVSHNVCRSKLATQTHTQILLLSGLRSVCTEYLICPFTLETSIKIKEIATAGYCLHHKTCRTVKFVCDKREINFKFSSIDGVIKIHVIKDIKKIYNKIIDNKLHAKINC